MSRKKRKDDEGQEGPVSLPLPGLSQVGVPATPTPEQPAPAGGEEQRQFQRRRTPLEREALAHELSDALLFIDPENDFRADLQGGLGFRLYF